MTEQKIYALIGKQFVKRAIGCIGIAAIGLGINLFSVLKTYWAKESAPAVSFNLSYVMVIIFLIIAGWYYSAKEYAGLMSIQARRKAYLKGIAIIGGMGSIALMSLVYMVIQGTTFCIAYWLKDYVIESSFDLNIRGIISLWGTGEIAFALGFFLGALTYRFKIITAISLVSFLPLLVLISILSHYLFEDEMSMYWMMVMLFIARSLVSGWGQLIYIALFWILGWYMLRQAPIKSYAHDLV